jgi:zinc transport system substrate-binding protein
MSHGGVMKAVLLFCLLSLSFFHRGAVYGSEYMDVAVSIPPQAYFVQQIGGARVNVQVLIRSGDDPHTYEPRPAQMAALSKSLVYFSIGLPFEEPLLSRLVSLNPSLRIVETYAGIERMPGDPHIWLAPSLVKVQGIAIRDGLMAVDPGHKEEYSKNYDQFCQIVDDLDHTIRELLERVRKKDFVVAHPSWGYFAREYGLHQISMEREGKEPKASDLAALIQLMKERNIKSIFVSPQYSRKMAENLARETNGTIIAIDPLPWNWMDDMAETARAIGGSLQ